MAKPVDYNATLIERVDLTSALAIFKIRPDNPFEGEDPWFLPGQYVTLGLNNEEQPELGSVRRPMSIASAPREREAMEFYVRWVGHPESDNPLTHLLWKTKAGDRIFLRNKPVGKFTLNHTVGLDDPRLHVFVAAGTGLAPFISLVRDHRLRKPDVDLSRYAILHGASYPADLCYREELESYRDEGLKYATTVSRPKEASGWKGDCGRVEDYFAPGRLEELDDLLGLGAGGLKPKNAAIFICGLTGTIGQIIKRTAFRGFVPETRKLRRALEVPDDVASSLFFEQYDTTPIIEVDDPEIMEPLRKQLHTTLADG
jgi:ferredoxin--NADP+ reductase